MRLAPWLARFKVTGEHDVYEAMARQRRRVLESEALAVKRLVGAYGVARVGIEQRLEAVVQRIAQAQAAGVLISPAWLYQQDRFLALLNEIDGQIAKYSQAASGIVATGAAGMAQMGAAHAGELMTSVGLKGDFTLLARDALENSVGLLSDKSPVHDLFAAMPGNAVAAARTAFAQEIASGTNPKVLARRLAGSIETVSASRAVLIARTEHMRVYTAAQQANYAANSDVVVAARIVSARDARTCFVCLAQDGRIIQHGEPFARHPGCRCALAPIPLYGSIDEPTGEEWLKTLPPERQIEYLGPKRHQLWSTGQVTLADLIGETEHPRWGRGVRQRNLKEVGAAIASGGTGKVFVVKPAGLGVVDADLAGSADPIGLVVGEHQARLAAAAAAKLTTADIVLHQQVGGQAGSNQGGFYLGQDGVNRYVKFYGDPAQAWSEHLSNEIYRRLGLGAPKSVVFDHQGKTVYASELLDTESTLGQAFKTKSTAVKKKLSKSVLDGLAADILTANWDAVGLDLDNVVLLKSGGVARIDQGGTLLFRAQAGRKPKHVLEDIPEWDGLFSSAVNPAYSKVAQAAGVASADEMAAVLSKQVKQILKVRDDAGGWAAFVDAAAPGLQPADRDAIVGMLNARTDLLKARVAKAQAAQKAAKKAALAAKTASPGATGSGGFKEMKSSADAQSLRSRLAVDGNSGIVGKAAQALSYYKGNGYVPMNRTLRSGVDTGTTSRIDSLRKAYRDRGGSIPEDMMLFRGVRRGEETPEGWHRFTKADIGKTISDRAFISYATLESFSRDDWIGGSQTGVLLRVRVPKGTRYITPYSAHSHDYEYEVITHGSMWKIVDVYETTNSRGAKVKVLEVELTATMEGTTDWVTRWQT